MPRLFQRLNIIIYKVQSRPTADDRRTMPGALQIPSALTKDQLLLHYQGMTHCRCRGICGFDKEAIANRVCTPVVLLAPFFYCVIDDIVFEVVSVYLLHKMGLSSRRCANPCRSIICVPVSRRIDIGISLSRSLCAVEFHFGETQHNGLGSSINPPKEAPQYVNEHGVDLGIR